MSGFYFACVVVQSMIFGGGMFTASTVGCALLLVCRKQLRRIKGKNGARLGDLVYRTLAIGLAIAWGACWAFRVELAGALLAWAGMCGVMWNEIASKARKQPEAPERNRPVKQQSTIRVRPVPAQAARPQPVQAAAPEPPRPAPEPPRSEEKVEEGDEQAQYEKLLEAIREANRRIENREVSDRIRQIESLTEKIFAQVKQRPNMRPSIRGFMNYYLPTTLKLLDAYAVMEAQDYEGENIAATMRQIEEVLGTLATAFGAQLDRLFKSQALDVSTDIDVLETMLSKDGLLKDSLVLDLKDFNRTAS